MTAIATSTARSCAWCEATPTDFWNDSCAVAELAYAVERGGTGATSNPVIVRRGDEEGEGPLGAAGPRDDRGRTRPGPRSSSPGR